MLEFNPDRAILLLSAILIFSGCQRPQHAEIQTETKEPDSHERMVELLALLKFQSSGKNEFFGTSKEAMLRQQLKGVGEYAATPRKLQLLGALSDAQLVLGKTEEAIDHLEQAVKLFPNLKDVVPEDVEDQLAFRQVVAQLRLAENQNCVHCRNGESCLFPIRGEGVHQEKQAAEKAIEYLTPLLNRNRDNMEYRWLLNVAYMTIGGYPADIPEEWLIPPDAFESDEPFPRFKNISDQLGLDVVSLSGGTIVDDFNNDGWLDVVTSSWSTSGQIRFFQGRGSGSFVENTIEAGLKGIFGGLNMLQADFDSDGDIDILVLRGAWLDKEGDHPNSLLANDGNGHFRDVTFDVGLGDYHFPTQTACWADYDNDGDLDLFVGNEKGPSQLFNNDGHGHFLNVAEHAGVTNDEMAKGSGWGDYDNDRYPDLYVSNLDGPNRLYRNNGDGTFKDVADASGVAGPQFSFPMWFWDFNNDGALDLFVAAYRVGLDHFVKDYLDIPHDGETDRLYQGDGKGGFRDVTKDVNLDHVTLPMGSNFGDLDNDGFQDFYLGTGYPNYEAIIPNRMFHNLNGQRFADISTAGGFGHLQKGHGVAFADFDHDGDQDVFIEMGGAYLGDAFANAVFENPGFDNHWIVIKLVGQKSNRAGIGARIRAVIEENGQEQSIYKWVNTGGSFGANPLRQHLGLRSATTIKRLEIYWPTTDKLQQFDNVVSDQMIEITEGQQPFKILSASAVNAP